jgi:transcriptional regulator with XRE-family HTH domain
MPDIVHEELNALLPALRGGVLPAQEDVVADRGGEQYSRIVSDLRETVSTEDLARIIGIHSRQIQNWAAGRNRPQGENREQLLGVYYLVQRLRDVYRPEGIEIWLHSRNREFDARRQLDLLVAGEYERVLAAVERLADGTPS